MGNQYNRSHGLYGTPEYKAWDAMVQRCTNPNDKRFPDYGGRGIEVCERWRTSGYFLQDMGPKPSPKHSLERVDNAGPYGPTNCRWALIHDQLRNTRRNRRIEFRGETRCLTDWAELHGLSAKTVSCRLDNYGWSVEDALLCPKQKGVRPANRKRV